MPIVIVLFNLSGEKIERGGEDREHFFIPPQFSSPLSILKFLLIAATLLISSLAVALVVEDAEQC